MGGCGVGRWVVVGGLVVVGGWVGGWMDGWLWGG